MKLVVKILALIITLLIVAIVLLVLVVDVNRFKPYIEAAAKEQGVVLQMGDLGWAFWPSLGVTVTDVKVAAVSAPQEPIAEIKEAGLMAALMPLLKGELKVNHVQVDGARIYLAVDKQGNGNWDALFPKNTPTATAPPNPSGQNDVESTLDINRIGIHNSSLTYSDAQTGQAIHLRNLNLDMTDVNTHGNPFELSLQWLMEVVQADTADKMQVEGKLSHRMTLDKNLNHLQVDNGNAQFTLVAASSADIALNYSLSVTELQNNPRYQGQLDVQPFNVRQALAALGTELETANSTALQQLSLSTKINGDTKQVSLDSLKLTLDKTRFTGSLAVTDFATSALTLALQGDNINLDDYLPPPSDAPKGATLEGATAAAVEDTPLPLDALRGLHLDAQVNLASISIKKIMLESVGFSIQANEGIVEQKFSANVSQGTVKFNSNIDLRPDKTNGNPDELQNNLSYKAQMELQSLNLRQLLTTLGTELNTANSDALKHFSLSAQINGDAKQVSLDSLKLTLDKTRFTGNLAVTDFSTSALKVALQGDNINVDDYLPPPIDVPEGAAAPAPAEDTPLPLDALRGLHLDAKVNLASMTIKKIALKAIDLRVNANNGSIEQKLSAKAYQGDINFASNTDTRTDKAALTFNGGVQGLELAPLLKDMEMDEKLGLSGAIRAQAQGTTQGASVNQLMATMNSTANFSGVQVRMSPLNIEEQFCKMVNLLTQNSTEEVTWDAFTEMRQLDGNMVWRDQVINLESFNAGVSQLLLASTGKINLEKGKYEFKLPIKLAKASQMASLKGCSVSNSNYWVDRGLSLLRCKGTFGAIDPVKDCGFDKSALGDLTKDYAEYKLREKHGAKIEAAEKKLDDKKQEVKQQLDDKKQELINKLQNKLFKVPKSAAAEAVTSSAASSAAAIESAEPAASAPATE